MRKYTLNQEYFDSITTPEQAYWLGFLTADGCISKSEKGYAVRLELAEKDRDHVQKFNNALRSNKPLRSEKPGTVKIDLGSRHLVESLERLGVHPRKSLTAEPWSGSSNLMPHYWRGLFDGDGTIFKASHKRNETTSEWWNMGICGSFQCVSGFAEWAKEITGSRAKVRLTGPKSVCWFWTVQGNKITIPLAETLYSSGAIALERKQVLADAILQGR